MNHDDLDQISQLLDKKLEPIKKQLDTVELKVELVNKRVESVEKKVEKAQENIINTLTELMINAYNVHEERIKNIEKQLHTVSSH